MAQYLDSIKPTGALSEIEKFWVMCILQNVLGYHHDATQVSVVHKLSHDATVLGLANIFDRVSQTSTVRGQLASAVDFGLLIYATRLSTISTTIVVPKQ